MVFDVQLTTEGWSLTIICGYLVDNKEISNGCYLTYKFLSVYKIMVKNLTKAHHRIHYIMMIEP